MWAIFACGNCGREAVHGRFEGDPMYQAKFLCLFCKKVGPFHFARYCGEEFFTPELSAALQKKEARPA
jgi:hypothetical protein